MQNAISSASELEYHLLLSHDLGYLSPEAYAPLDEQVVEIKKMLTAFIQRLRANR
jgi:four helix bundle protein